MVRLRMRANKPKRARTTSGDAYLTRGRPARVGEPTPRSLLPMGWQWANRRRGARFESALDFAARFQKVPGPLVSLQLLIRSLKIWLE